MSGFIQGADRNQGYLLPERIEEYVSEENPVRVIEAFVEELDLARLGFSRLEPNATGRPASMRESGESHLAAWGRLRKV
jgi:transposase